ncbi:MAG: aminotransferase class V-fold PLP-dependent enzyme [Candidatus Marinimicrobia bacterium]|jgi:selenocysteine lyase/cysteine desulfurase|nr:aminotransferase class V-fold PLP-dependent enzyme [Candidatus Neomarinimicrobiota bacterium]
MKSAAIDLEKYFIRFRRNIIGIDQRYDFPGGRQAILYADWAASGRFYRPIEEYMTNVIGPYVANTHTETTLTGAIMTDAYHQAHQIIKRHVNAGPDDVLLFAGFGMTAVINKFQRLLGLRLPDKFRDKVTIPPQERALVLLTHMEHHSNQTTWEECCCDTLLISKKSDGLPDLEHLRNILELNRDRKTIIGSFTACSNVTGLITPIHEMAAIMHEFGRSCFVDYSASAPYVEMNMHPVQPEQKLDAIFFSPHKFLGGPGSSGVILFDKKLYDNRVPDQPGGGTVLWTNPWGEHHFFPDIEVREDGGTPGFLQAIRAALAILLKEEMGTQNLQAREHYLTELLLSELADIPEIIVLEAQNHERIGFVSLYSRSMHHNLIARLLNDRFGIQTRGGCLCAGTYGHILLNISDRQSKEITKDIDQGDLRNKPGWVRISLHPTMTEAEVRYIAAAVREIIKNHARWGAIYHQNPETGDFELPGQSKASIDLKSTFKTT